MILNLYKLLQSNNIGEGATDGTSDECQTPYCSTLTSEHIEQGPCMLLCSLMKHPVMITRNGRACANSWNCISGFHPVIHCMLQRYNGADL